jgi:cytochrome c biogenesis protein CcmG/thiol:disulfide interchange protein DsbE
MHSFSRRKALTALLALWSASSVRASSARITKWDVTKPTPALDLMTVDGAHWNLASLRGKTVVLNFWATWCEPCLAEMPQLNAFARKHTQDGQLVVLGINYQEGEAAIRRFSEKTPVDFPLLRDTTGAAFRAWGNTVLPSSVFVSRSGQARVAIQGELNWESAQVTDLLQAVLADRLDLHSK